MDLTLPKEEFEVLMTDKSNSQTESLNKLHAVELAYIGGTCGMVSFE